MYVLRAKHEDWRDCWGATLAGYAAFVYLSNGDTVLLGGKLMVLPPIAIIGMIVAIIKGRGGKEQPAQWAPQQQVPQQQWPAAAQQSHPHGAMPPPQQQWGAPRTPHPPQWGAPQAPQPSTPQAPQQYPPTGYGYPPPQYRR